MVGSYADLTRIKNYLNITDTNDDTYLNQQIAVANQHTDDLLQRFANLVPLTGANITGTVNFIADSEVCAAYNGYIGKKSQKDDWNAQRDQKVIDLEGMYATADGADRFKPMAYSQTYRSTDLAARTGL